mgnify:CR=1 FL=1
MKQTENYEQLLERFDKRLSQVGKKKIEMNLSEEQRDAWENFKKAFEGSDISFRELMEVDHQLHYLRGCKETVEYLMTGQLPNDGNHDGMDDHKPRHGGDMDSL